MTSTLELYRRIGNAMTKEKRKPIEETTPRKVYYHCMVYHKHGWATKAKRVRLSHFRNIDGSKGKASYAITFLDGNTLYYPREDIVGIMPIVMGDK